MIELDIVKAINSFAGDEPVKFSAYPDQTLPKDVTEDKAAPYVSVRITSEDDEARTSDRTERLYSAFVDVFISTRTMAEMAAVKRSILLREAAILDDDTQLHWNHQDWDLVTPPGSARHSAVLELQVWSSEDWTVPAPE